MDSAYLTTRQRKSDCSDRKYGNVARALRELNSSDFQSGIASQKSRKAVGHGHRNTDGARPPTYAAAAAPAGADTSVGHGPGDGGEDGSRRSKETTVTGASCPECRLRFTPAAAAYLPSCPTCGGRIQPIERAAAAIGLCLFRHEDIPPSLPEAVAVSIETPDPSTRHARSGPDLPF
jgi:hypothetical protein